MTRKWIRNWNVTIGTGGSLVNVSELRIRFSVRQAQLQTPANADVLISNLSPKTSEKIEKEGVTVSIAAGHVGDAATIFEGNIIQKRFGRETPTDTYAAIVATGGDLAYNFATVNKSFSSGSTFKDHVNMVLEAMAPFGVTAGQIADLGTAKMARGRAFFGMARDVMRDIGFATKTTWFIENNKLNVIKDDEPRSGDAIVLNSSTGLIGRPTQTFDGIVGRCLLTPRLKPGVILQINQASIDRAQFSPNYTAAVQNAMYPSVADDGFYRTLYVDHNGDNFDQPWYSDFICIRADGQGPQPIRMVNKGVSLDPGSGAQ